MKLWIERPRAPRTPTWWCARASVRIVAVVKHQGALGEEEGEEADGHERGGPLGVADLVDPLRQHVEESDGDDDPAGQRDHRRQRVREAQRDPPADQRRDHGQPGEGNRDGRHGFS